MKPPRWVSPLFWLAAVYDGGLGVLFLVAPRLPFEWFEVTPPNHMAYVQFPAALLIIFGLMFVAVALRPVANRGLILYGVLLKLAYAGIAGAYWITSDIPGMWKPLAVCDLAMAVLFAGAYWVLWPFARHERR